MARLGTTVWRGDKHPSQEFGNPPAGWRFPAVRSYYEGVNGIQVRNKYTDKNMRQLRRLQLDDVAATGVNTVAQGLFNPDGNKDTYGDSGSVIPLDGPWPTPPIAQGITGDGSLVNVLEERSGWFRIETFQRDNWDVENRPPETHPWLYCNPFPSVQTGTGEKGNAIDSRGILFPLLARAEAWLPPGSVVYNEVEPVTDIKTTYAKGKDFSHHAEFHDPTVNPLDFDILKLGLGTWTDPRAQPNGDLYESIQTSPARGGYWYYKTGIGWKQQCDNLLAASDGDYYHFIAWDYERKNNVLTGQTADFCQMSMEYLRAYSGKKVLLYSNVPTFNDNLYPYDTSARKWYADEDLWIAQWPSKSWYDKPTKTAPTMPKGVNNWKIWQYGGDQWTWYGIYGYKEAYLYGLGKDSVDLNHFNGTPEVMNTFFDIDGTIPVPPVPPTGGNETAIAELTEVIDFTEQAIIRLEG